MYKYKKESRSQGSFSELSHFLLSHKLKVFDLDEILSVHNDSYIILHDIK